MRATLNGNLVRNGNFTTLPAFTAATTTAGVWIDGTASGYTGLLAYGWAIVAGSLSASAQAQFDPNTTYLGNSTIKLETLDTSGVLSCGTYLSGQPTTAAAISLRPTTAYTLTFGLKTTTVATNSAFVDLRQYNAAGTLLATTTSTKFSGTNSFTQVTVTVTTEATTTGGALLLRNNVAGSIGAAWFGGFQLAATTPVVRTTA